MNESFGRRENSFLQEDYWLMNEGGIRKTTHFLTLIQTVQQMQKLVGKI